MARVDSTFAITASIKISFLLHFADRGAYDPVSFCPRGIGGGFRFYRNHACGGRIGRSSGSVVTAFAADAGLRRRRLCDADSIHFEY